MDTGSIFLICFIVSFGSLLIGGWWFGHPLLMLFARWRVLQRPAQQSLGRGSGMAQAEEESPISRHNLRRYNLPYWKNSTRQSATSPLDNQPNHSPRASPASSISSTFSRTKSSCGIHKATELDVIKELHDFCNMIPVPPVPKQSLSRRVADIGTQAPPGALLARRSQDALTSKSSAHSATSGSSSYYGDISSLRAVTPTSPILSRTRTTGDAATPSPLRQASRPDSLVDQVPLTPAHLTTKVEAKESANVSVPQALPIVPTVIQNSDIVVDIAKPNKEQINTAEFKVNAAKVAIKTPCKVQQAGQNECYEVKVTNRPATTSEWPSTSSGGIACQTKYADKQLQSLLSMSPLLGNSSPPEIDAFKTPPSQSSLNWKNRSAGLSFTDSIRRLAKRGKATPTDEEASPSIKITISGPSSYVPNIGSGWSPNEYLTLHNAKPIENPLIEHPAIGPRQFQIDRGFEEEGNEDDSSMMISYKLKQLDRHLGYKTPRKGRHGRSPPTMLGEE